MVQPPGAVEQRHVVLAAGGDVDFLIARPRTADYSQFCRGGGDRPPFHLGSQYDQSVEPRQFLRLDFK